VGVGNAKTLTVVACVATATLVPLVAAASSQPSPPTLKAIVAGVRSEVNARFPADDQAGESTSCAYVRNDVRVGYAFTCVTSVKAARVARTTVTMLLPHKQTWVWRYATTSLAGGTTESRVTYRVTATGTTSALDITYDGSSGQVQLTLVPLPFTVTLSHVRHPEILAQSDYGTGTTSITCEIQVNGQTPIKDTAEGSGAVASCG